MSRPRWLTDEDFDNDILRGVLRVAIGIDVIRVQDIELSGKTDEIVLAFAADDGRILLTHDVSTMLAHAWERVARGIPMPGIFVVPQRASIGAVIADIALIDECSAASEWESQVRYLPL
ncbi:MAG: DUF5615 family PIN-like protein [Planctomycetaceae bacterium]